MNESTDLSVCVRERRHMHIREPHLVRIVNTAVNGLKSKCASLGWTSLVYSSSVHGHQYYQVQCVNCCSSYRKRQSVDLLPESNLELQLSTSISCCCSLLHSSQFPEISHILNTLVYEFVRNYTVN